MTDNRQSLTREQKSGSNYKDTLFRTLFRDKGRAVELCNALEGTDYPPDAKVVLCDLEDSLLRRFNDLAFAVEDQLILMCEHQASINPNMALRFLSYTADTIFSHFVDAEKIYGRKLIEIPAPKFYVLYNGTEKPKQDILRLSDSFRVKGGEFSVELTVKVLDVNYGSGCEALARSKSLDGYAYLIEQIRMFEREGLSRDKAIEAAIKKCVRQGVLADFLDEHFREVSSMLHIQYDREAELRVIRAEGIEEGRAEGIEKGIEKGRTEGKAKTAIEMLGGGMSAQDVARFTKMPIEWVEGLTVKA